jgi:RsmE family RNA methyltransferase
VNLLLLRPEELGSDGTARLVGRRLAHALEILRSAPGDLLRVGVRGGRLGSGEVVQLDASALVLKVVLDTEPPPRAGVDLVLALPRPKAIKKVLPALASLGVDRVFLVNAARVEKSYFGSRVLAEGFLEDLLDLGLEQARDTVPPRLHLRDRFRPFVEDELGRLLGGGAVPPSRRFLAHPAGEPAAIVLPPLSPGERVALAVGPEGGWVPFEVDLLAGIGFHPFSLGPRILRVETAVATLLAHVDARRTR